MSLSTLLLSMLLLHISAAKEGPSDHLKKSLRPAKNDVLAFSADLSKDYVAGPGSTIVFDRIITNVGDLYFNGTGQFLCTDGLWMFTWNLAKATVAGLPGMRGIGSLRTGAIERKYGPKTSYYDTGVSGVSEMTAILECTTSPPTVVSIAAQPWTEDVSSTSVFWGNLTTFSGFKLHAGIAFTAELSHDQYALPGGRVMFDNDLANVGGYYEPIHGYFRCPDAGVYVFSISTHTPDPATPWSVSRLMMEREMVMQGPITYIAYNATYDSGSSSITAVLQCTPSFSVYVESQSAHDFRENSYGAKLTSFSGFKLYDITTETIAFFTILTQNFTSSLSNDPIPFDELITNVGGAFDISNSRFVCPDNEYYLFTWTATTAGGNRYIDLHMDGSLVKRLYTSPYGNSDSLGTSGSCTQSVILQCQAGSMFQVVKASATSVVILGGYTSFSGYKLPG